MVAAVFPHICFHTDVAYSEVTPIHIRRNHMASQ